MADRSQVLLIQDGLSRPVSISLAAMFNLGWVLGRVGYDPCDEWDIDTVLGLPDGLTYSDGCPQYRCVCCDNWAPWEGEIADFVEGDDMNLCGGSPRCCP